MRHCAPHVTRSNTIFAGPLVDIVSDIDSALTIRLLTIRVHVRTNARTRIHVYVRMYAHTNIRSFFRINNSSYRRVGKIDNYRIYEWKYILRFMYRFKVEEDFIFVFIFCSFFLVIYNKLRPTNDGTRLIRDNLR